MAAFESSQLQRLLDQGLAVLNAAITVVVLSSAVDDEIRPESSDATQTNEPIAFTSKM